MKEFMIGVAVGAVVGGAITYGVMNHQYQKNINMDLFDDLFDEEVETEEDPK